jgi:hypothetical protein
MRKAELKSFVMRLSLLAVLPFFSRGWDNGAALTPPMGFANWNVFGCSFPAPCKNQRRA